MKPALKIISAAVTVILSFSGPSAQAATQYTALNLGTVYATSLNASGQVAGITIDENGMGRGFFTGANGMGMTFLNTPAGESISNVVINDSGQLAGSVGGVGFFADAGGQTMTTVSYQGANTTKVLGINASGQIVGTADNHPFISGPHAGNLQMLDLGDTGSDFLQAAAINASGQIVGSIEGMWSDRYEIFITGANGQNATWVKSVGNPAAGYALNDHGDLVGEFATENGDHHALLVKADGTVHDLGNLGGSFNTARAINNLGQVVGSASQPDDGPFSNTGLAFITDPDAQTMVDLNTLLVDFGADNLLSALAINDSGQILAYGAFGDTYLLSKVSGTAVPEASTSALMLLGFGALAFAVKRKARQQQAS